MTYFGTAQSRHGNVCVSQNSRSGGCHVCMPTGAHTKQVWDMYSGIPPYMQYMQTQGGAHGARRVKVHRQSSVASPHHKMVSQRQGSSRRSQRLSCRRHSHAVDPFFMPMCASACVGTYMASAVFNGTYVLSSITFIEPSWLVCTFPLHDLQELDSF